MGFAGAKIPSKSRARTLIEMSFSLRTIDLDFSSGTFSTSGWMTLEWDDPRYRWEPSEYDNIVSVPLPFSKVWAPEVILHNSVEERFIYRQIGVVHHTGHFVYVIAAIQSLLAVPILRAFHGGCKSAVFSLGLGSTVSTGLSIAFPVTVRL